MTLCTRRDDGCTTVCDIVRGFALVESSKRFCSCRYIHQSQYALQGGLPASTLLLDAALVEKRACILQLVAGLLTRRRWKVLAGKADVKMTKVSRTTSSLERCNTKRAHFMQVSRQQVRRLRRAWERSAVDTERDASSLHPGHHDHGDSSDDDLQLSTAVLCRLHLAVAGSTILSVH